MSHLEEARKMYAAGLERVRTTPPPANQKFLPGTFVYISKDLGSSMQHFECDTAAQVQYVYNHAYGESQNAENHSYSLLVRSDYKNWRVVAWYWENQLSEITDKDLIAQYKIELEGRENE